MNKLINTDNYEHVGHIGVYPVSLDIHNKLIYCKEQLISYLELKSIITGSLDRVKIKSTGVDDFYYHKIHDQRVLIGCLVTTYANMLDISSNCKRAFIKAKAKK